MRNGLSVPIVTILDEEGNILEEEQRKVVNYTIQNGNGADCIFICGTTGEYNRITHEQSRKVIEIAVEEIKKANESLPKEKQIEIWVGVTSSTKLETLSLIKLAVELKAEVAVIAPYAIGDLLSNDVVEFFTSQITPILQGTNTLVGLYDNPDINAAQNGTKNVPVELIEELRRIPYVEALKASCSRSMFGEYVRDFARGKAASFTLYAGNAGLIFEVEDIQREVGIDSVDVEIVGVVSGPGNAFPREWKYAWEAVDAHDSERSIFYRKFFDAFLELTFFQSGGEDESRVRTMKLIACIKQAMLQLGVISSAAVAVGTPRLSEDEIRLFNDGFSKLLSETQFPIGAKSVL